MTRNDLYTLIQQLRKRLDDLEATLAESSDTINGLDLAYATEGTPIWSAKAWPSSGYQNLIVSDSDGNLYRMQPTTLEGNPSFELIPADVLVASDGSKWRARVIYTEGQPNLADPETWP